MHFYILPPAQRKASHTQGTPSPPNLLAAVLGGLHLTTYLYDFFRTADFEIRVSIFPRKVSYAHFKRCPFYGTAVCWGEKMWQSRHQHRKKLEGKAALLGPSHQPLFAQCAHLRVNITVSSRKSRIYEYTKTHTDASETTQDAMELKKGHVYMSCSLIVTTTTVFGGGGGTRGLSIYMLRSNT